MSGVSSQIFFILALYIALYIFLRYFRNEPTPQFSKVPCCKTKSLWRPPNGHPALEIFLSKVEKDLFDICKKQQTYSNFNSEEWKAMRSLADDRNLVIKKQIRGPEW